MKGEPMKIVSFVVPGEPMGKGRPKFDTRGPYVRAVTPQHTINYETLIKMEYERRYEGFAFPKEVPLCMRIVAYCSIPKSASKKKILAMLSNLLFPTKKPDWDNIGKVVCDALNKIAFYDDSQITDGRVLKRYSENPRLEVTIHPEESFPERMD